jgi:hypothetical protein
MSLAAVVVIKGDAMEHRWGQRKAAHQRVRLLTAGGIAAHGIIQNVSTSGAFVKTALPGRILSTVQIAFISENQRSRSFRTVAAQVVRTTAEGLGLEWCEQVPGIMDALVTTPTPGKSLTLPSSGHAPDIADAVRGSG